MNFMVIKLWKIDRYYFHKEIYKNTKSRSKEGFEKIKVFEWKAFFGQKLINNDYISLNTIQLVVYIKITNCAYPINDTVMTVTLFYCYYINNYLLII
jgi:hypothetical protein